MLIYIYSTNIYVIYIKYIKYKTFTTDIGWLDIVDEAAVTYPAVGTAVGVAVIDEAVLL